MSHLKSLGIVMVVFFICAAGGLAAQLSDMIDPEVAQANRLCIQSGGKPTEMSLFASGSTKKALLCVK